MTEYMDTIGAIFPIILGVAHIFRPFIEDQKYLENRCTRIISDCKEEIAVALRRLIYQKLRTTGFDNVDRGDGEHTPDFYGDLAKGVTRQAILVYRTSFWLTQYRDYSNVILFGLYVGLLCFILSFLFDGLDIYILLSSIFALTLQFIAVIKLRHLTDRSKDDKTIL